MKLFEIVGVPVQSHHNITDMSVFDNTIRFKKASVEKYPLYYSEDNSTYYFCLEENGNKFAFIIAQKNIFNGKSCVVIQRTWVIPEYRNNGIMKAMYNTLHNQGLTVLSDIELSPQSKSIWKALTITGRASVIDTTTEQIRKATDADFTSDINNTRFIMEHCVDRFWVPLNNDVVLEHSMYINNRYKEIQ